jgi:hypothetical protein
VNDLSCTNMEVSSVFLIKVILTRKNVLHNVFFSLFSLIIIQYMRKLYVMFMIGVFRTGRVIAILYSTL